MIRELGILAVAVCCVVASTEPKPLFDTNNFASTQKFFFDLLWHCDQPKLVHPEIYKLGTAFDFDANIDRFTDKVVFRELIQRYKYGMVPPGALFSVFYPDHRDEAIALFKFFYSANDLQTFAHAAAWARVYMNVDLFVYAFYVAILHRPDTKNFRLPLPYEIQPNYYFNADIMQQAYDFKMGMDPHADTSSQPQYFIIQANYSNGYNTDMFDPESKLNYYLEDASLSAYYYYFNLETPFWMPSERYNQSTEYRGEMYYYCHKSLLNRYLLERYSHGLGGMEPLEFNKPVMTGYTPDMAYRNGFRFPSRPHWTKVPLDKYDYLQKAKEYESRITAGVDYGYLLTTTGKFDSLNSKEGFNMLGNIIQGNADSSNRNFYGSVDHVTRSVFGYNPKPISKYEIFPSALEQFSTSMRDPAFYRIYQKIINYFYRYKKHMKSYTYDELVFSGVEIDSVAIDKLSTFMDYTDSLISNAVRVHDHQDAESLLIKARQYRLNHKPYTYHITVKSDKETKAIIRMFVGPKYNDYGKQMDISESHQYFYELDHFTADLKPGTNKIERKSTESIFTVPDYESSDIFYKKLVQAVENGSELPVDRKIYGFPRHLMLPRGTKSGMPVQFFFYISKFTEDSSQTVNSRLMGEWLYDGKAFGFPLDRQVYGFNFTVPNMFFKDAYIYHNDEEISNSTA